jgi:ribose transport system permease protein
VNRLGRLFGPTTSRDLIARIAIVFLAYIVLMITVSGFGTTSNFYAILVSAVPIGIMAAGLGAVIIGGELDLSVGSVASVTGILAVKLVHMGALPAILIATAIGLVIGVVQGYSIAKLRINSLVFTLGTLIALQGIAYVLTKESTVSVPISKLSIATDLKEKMWLFCPASIVMLVGFIAVGSFMRWHRFGRELYAIGGARQESRVAGVAQTRPLLIGFMLSAGFAALAGSIASLMSGSASPQAYNQLLLQSVTAVLVGGVSLYGGRGSILGVFIGVLLLQGLLSALALLGAPFWASSTLTGGLLVAFALLDLAEADSPARHYVTRYRNRIRARRATPTPASSDSAA